MVFRIPLIAIAIAVSIGTCETGYAVPILPLQFNPASIQFGNVVLGSTSLPLTVTLSPFHPTTTFGPIRLQLSDPNHFQIVSDSCSGASLTGADTCAVEASFSPDLFGHYSSFLVVLNESGVLGNFIPLEGLGVESGFPGPPDPLGTETAVSSSATSLDFGMQNPGTQSAPLTVTLSNIGSSDLRVEATTFGGDAPFNFARIDACMPQLVAPGGTCALTAYFTPISTDPAAAALAVTANIPDSPIVIELAGNSVAPPPSGGGCSLGITDTPSALSTNWISYCFLLMLAWFRRRE